MMGIHWDFVMVVHQASITDWIQALAASVAVVGTLFTLWKLYQRDEQKQEMIGELQQQTKHFGAQVDQLGAQVFQLKNIHEAIAEGIRILARSEELDIKVRKIKIRPEFEFQTSMLKPGHLQAEICLKNRGGNAMETRARLSGGDARVAVSPPNPRSGDEITIFIGSIQKLDTSNMELELQFQDEEGTAYVQRLSFSPGAHHLTIPEMVSPNPHSEP